MTHVRENLSIMDAAATTFGKQRPVSLSRSLAFILFFVFVACIVSTGLLVYYLSSCSATISNKIEESNALVVRGVDGKRLSVEFTTSSARFIAESTTLVVEPNPVSRIPNTVQISTTTTIRTPNTTELLKTKTEKSRSKYLDVRLPKSLYPLSYKIALIPFIRDDNFTFHGDVQIAINVTETSNNITLHNDNLTISTVEVFEYLRRNNNQTHKSFIPIRNTVNDTKRQFLIINLRQPVKAGQQYYVHIKFKGVLNDLLLGFYRSSYKLNNETKWIAATQFQATDARKAFPCFDEPALKATFQLSIARPKHMNSMSNMRQVHHSSNSSADDDTVLFGLPDYVWDHYEESKPMSTYLIAFVVSDFECIQNGTFRVCTRPGAISQAKYSLKIGPQVLKFYEDFFGIKYPLPKIDMVGLPDFSAGAMENWGLITYRESVLLFDEKVSSRNHLPRIAHVVAHELAHQWFGNLVTPVWWSDLWLNEGFATYAEFLGADAVNPKLKELDQFVNTELHGAFMLDALKLSHPISVKVNNPDEINDIFDSISYSKGASIIRMMQHFLTMSVFQKGLNKYLRSRMYGNAEQNDLWHTLTEQSHADHVLDANFTIKEIMDTWTLQTGFPVVTAVRDYRNDSMCLRQERFLLGGHKDRALWWIPITYTDSKSGGLRSTWLRAEPNQTLARLGLSSTDWLVINVNQTGYYRVNYDKTNWDLIIAQLHRENGHVVFDPKNRAQFLDDTLNLASAGYLSYDVALNLTMYLRHERDFVPWKAAFTNLDYLYDMFVRTAHFDKYKAYMLELIKNIYAEVGFNEKPDEDELIPYIRIEIFTRACKLGVRDCIINSVQQFETWKNSPNPDKYNLISENLRGIVYCTAISVGGQEEWDFTWQRYVNANVESKKETLLWALGCSKEIWILSRYLEWAITDNAGIRKHDVARVFVAVASNPVGQQLAYRFLKTNWDRIKSHLGSSSMSLSRIVRSCTVQFNTPVEVDDFESFLGSKPDQFGIGLRTAEQSIEQARANVKWMANHYGTIVRWLSSTKS